MLVPPRAVRAPLPHIAVHLVEAPLIGSERRGGQRLAAVYTARPVAIREVSVKVGLISRHRLAKRERSGAARPARKLPLRFGRKVGRARWHECVQAVERFASITPTYVFDWTRVALEVTRILACEHFPQRLCARRVGKPVTTSDLNGVLRTFV